MSHKKFLIIFNENAKRVRQTKWTVYKRLQKEGIKGYFTSLNKLKDIKHLEKYETIIAVGGDGTILGVLPYVIGNNKKLGIIPNGTANLFAESLGIPKNIQKALDIILGNNSMKVDIGKVGEKYFSLRVGTGFDANIINGTSVKLKKYFGYAAYLIHGIINALKLESQDYTLNIDGKEIKLKANSIIIANAGNMFKSFCKISPDGTLNDGKLDIFILQCRNLKDFLGVLTRIVFGIKEQSNWAHCFQAQTVKIESDNNRYHIDGESFKDKNIEISLIPEAVNVLVP